MESRSKLGFGESITSFLPSVGNSPYNAPTRSSQVRRPTTFHKEKLPVLTSPPDRDETLRRQKTAEAIRLMARNSPYNAPVRPTRLSSQCSRLTTIHKEKLPVLTPPPNRTKTLRSLEKFDLILSDGTETGTVTCEYDSEVLQELAKKSTFLSQLLEAITKGACEESLSRSLNLQIITKETLDIIIEYYKTGKIEIQKQVVQIYNILEAVNFLMIIAPEFTNTALYDAITRGEFAEPTIPTKEVLNPILKNFLSYYFTRKINEEIKKLNTPDELIKYLKKMNSEGALKFVTSLELIGKGLIEEEVCKILSLPGFTNLKELNISKNEISDIEALTKLACLQNLISLNISGNDLSSVKDIMRFSKLSSLDLSKNRIKKLDSITQLSELQSLNISNNLIDDEGVKDIAQLKKLTALNISHNLIGSEGAKFIAQLSKLESLDISHNDIEYKGAEAIAQLSKLKSLDISYNNIGLLGADAIAQLSKLESLNISQNNIRYKGAKFIAQLSKLKSLDISYNNIGLLGADAIAQLSKLESLNISQNNIRYKGAKFIAQLRELKSLDISYNDIGPVGAYAIAKLSNLESLNISHNGIGYEGVQSIARLSNLTYLDTSGNDNPNLEYDWAF